MAKSKFRAYLQDLMQYQKKSLPSGDKLSRDYIIIYDYIMDLLAEDEIISKFLVRKKQKVSNINADVLLDLTKHFKICHITEETIFSLTLQDDDNLEKMTTTTPHPFCNENLAILPNKITKHVWLAIKKGLTAYSPFVRGYHGDIYELSISPENFNECYVRIRAFNDDVVLNATLRILIKFYKHSNDLKTEKFAVVPRRRNCSMFEIYPLSYENSLKKDFLLISVLRLMQFIYGNRDDFYSLDADFFEAITLSEFMYCIPKCLNKDYNLVFRRTLLYTFKVFKSKNLPHILNSEFNLMHWVDDNTCQYAYEKSMRLLNEYNMIKHKNDLTYAEFCAYFELEEMDPFTYEVDQFGVFKSYKG